MGRLLLLLVLSYLVWLGIESLLNRLRTFGTGGPRPAAGPRRAAPPRDVQGIETLVRCAGCGVHVSRSRTLTQGGEPYCSEECRRRAAQSA